jgi:hypothetical protein
MKQKLGTDPGKSPVIAFYENSDEPSCSIEAAV